MPSKGGDRGGRQSTLSEAGHLSLALGEAACFARSPETLQPDSPKRLAAPDLQRRRRHGREPSSCLGHLIDVPFRQQEGGEDVESGPVRLGRRLADAAGTYGGGVGWRWSGA
jgi:hypothetical protein